ncbi:MAG: AAA family ATPase, partial [bacterium]
MKRLIEEKLIAWKEQADRKPLLLRGARQVGKTWTVLDFGRQNFRRVHRIDLEQRPDWHRVFTQDLVADRILSELEILLNTEIRPGQDLLFF